MCHNYQPIFFSSLFLLSFFWLSLLFLFPFFFSASLRRGPPWPSALLDSDSTQVACVAKYGPKKVAMYWFYGRSGADQCSCHARKAMKLSEDGFCVGTRRAQILLSTRVGWKPPQLICTLLVKIIKWVYTYTHLIKMIRLKNVIKMGR